VQSGGTQYPALQVVPPGQSLNSPVPHDTRHAPRMHFVEGSVHDPESILPSQL
jgi:hypothetical protein